MRKKSEKNTKKCMVCRNGGELFMFDNTFFNKELPDCPYEESVMLCFECYKAFAGLQETVNNLRELIKKNE